jgi:hypothetical protein
MNNSMLLSKDELEYYRKHHEEYYIKNYNCKNNFHIGQVVEISKDIKCNIGYAGELAIIEGYSGIDNYVHVFGYDNDSLRYWACGFNEEDLTETTIDYEDLCYEHRQEFSRWVRNNSSFLPKEPYNLIKKGNPYSINILLKDGVYLKDCAIFASDKKGTPSITDVMKIHSLLSNKSSKDYINFQTKHINGKLHASNIEYFNIVERVERE